MVQRQPHDDNRDQQLLGLQQQSGQQLPRLKTIPRPKSTDRSFEGSSFAGQVGNREQLERAG